MFRIGLLFSARHFTTMQLSYQNQTNHDLVMRG